MPLGTSYGAPTEREVLFAEAVCDAVPSVERLRMTSSGSEAVMGALRLARAATGRDVIVKVAGGYHGAIDGLLAEAGSGLTTLGVPSSPGVTAATTAATRIVPYNDAGAAADALEGAAAMIVEPVAGNMGVVPPAEGYLQALREACDRTGALLILDEVITGFRVARGGAQERYGVRADITCFGKVIGGGLPVGAFGGRRRRHARARARRGPATRRARSPGTPSPPRRGWPCSGSWRRPASTGGWRSSGAALEDAVVASGLPVTVNRVGSMLTPFFQEGPVRDYAEATAQRHGRLRAPRAGAARGGRLPAALAVRGLVRGPHPRRRGDRRDPRGARPGGGHRVRAAP